MINDDTAFLRMMDELLSMEGYRTEIHFASDTAFEMVRDTQPQLVILDIRMEKQESGWLVLDLLRLDPSTKDIPVIVCSADTVTLRAKAEHLRKYKVDVLEKPFELDDLLAQIDQYLSRPNPPGTQSSES